MLDCGSCQGPDTCTPVTCVSTGGSLCGVVSDGCGGTVDCGGCTGDEVCGGGGIAHQCAIPPQRASCTGLQGGQELDPASGGIQGLRECLGNGWCTDNGYMGAGIQDLWGFSQSDVWAVGGQGRGVALHWDGSSWRQVPLPTSEPLRGIWGASPGDVWAVGLNGTVLRWNGAEWRRFPAPTTEPLTAVSGTSSSDVWLVGPTLALHWDGQGLSETPGWTPLRAEPDDEYLPSRTSVWAIGAGDVVAAGGQLCQRWNGKAWARTPCGMHRATEVWASGSDDIWVIGEYFQGFSYYSQRAHWDGQKWTTETFSDFRNNDFERFYSLFGSSRNDVWLNGTWHFDGQKWSRICRRTVQTALWGTPTGHLFGHTEEGGLARLEEQGWSLQANTRFIHPSLSRAATGSSWGIGSSGTLIQFDGQRWSRRPGPVPDSEAYSFYTPFGTSPEDAWALSYGQELHRWNGQRWAPSGPPGLAVSTGWAISPTLAFAVAGPFHDRTMWRWDGQSWSPLDVQLGWDELLDMWGTGSDDVWAVGWHPPPNGSSCEGCADSLGVAWHWDGKRWTRVYAERGHYFKRVFATSPTNAWVLDFRNGSPTTAWALRWNGSTFERTGEFQDTHYLEHLAGTGPDDMWVAAGMTSGALRTRMYHFNGQHWTEQESLPGRIRAMGAIPGQVTFSTTEDGTLYESRR
jgi:hypothetical protein